MPTPHWSDEGPATLTGDLGQPANCPPDCDNSATCDGCGELTCPDHGRPEAVLGEDDAEDTHLQQTCRGTMHRACHAASCWDPAECFYDG